ncbi:probable pinoresinol-lariciresinol reductase 3 isoform X2 [Gastrolobium bilobum]|uniref:probable pinoresinol-lariciresinol reductase 3 isoform X2 n=1 Tax=Gastrolobium bilobum TaxID=150636 RepID=UPI002AB315EC|nr:probable pinoresinol-lariciresinol reductase 3 isoform X2 [Gastrolobium bilobum]
MMEKSKILVIGATGNLGYHLAEASLKFCHPTFALFRETAFSDPIKAHKLHSLSHAGATLLKGSLQDEASIVEAVKLVDVVICAVSAKQTLDQKLLIRVIKQTGSIKRFIPSEFGSDPTKVKVSELDDGYNFYAPKVEIRRLMEAEGIPYTCISCNFFMRVLLPSLAQPGLKAPPRDKVTIFGDGNTKAVFMNESDVAAFTINAVDDPRTLNKVLYLRPPGNVYSLNELVEMWETKIKKNLEKLNVSEEELLKKIKGTAFPANFQMLFIYSAFIKGDHTYFDIESSSAVNGVNGTKFSTKLTVYVGQDKEFTAIESH